MTGYPVVVRFPVHWAEVDAMGHVNNARYFTWFESARMALFQRVGLEIEGTPEIGPILAHTSCDFLAPVRFPADIEAGARVVGFGRTSFTMEFAVAAAGSDAFAARGRGVIVLIDYRDGAKVAIPPVLRAALEAFV
jgi:acyl-CoA thioester hydrolase